MFLFRSIPFVAAVAALGLASGAALAQTSALSRAVAVSDNQQPAIPRPEQNAAAAAKLAEFEKRAGKKPNIVILLIDDLGYGDPGAFGGGEAIGAATPNMDRLATEGLKLTSTYAQQTCTPTRSAIIALVSLRLRRASARSAPIFVRERRRGGGRRSRTEERI